MYNLFSLPIFHLVKWHWAIERFSKNQNQSDFKKVGQPQLGRHKQRNEPIKIRHVTDAERGKLTRASRS